MHAKTRNLTGNLLHIPTNYVRVTENQHGRRNFRSFLMNILSQRKQFRSIVIFMVAVALAFSAMLMSTTARAQDKKGGVIRLEVTTIEGRVQKPNAFFINTRRSLVYESIEVKDSFLKEVTKVVDSGDF